MLNIFNNSNAFLSCKMQTQIFGQIHHKKSLHMSKTIRLRVNYDFFCSGGVTCVAEKKKRVVHKENKFKHNFTCGIHTHLHTYSTVNMIVTVISFSVLKYKTISNSSFLKTHIMKKKRNQIHIAEHKPNNQYRCTLMPK